MPTQLVNLDAMIPREDFKEAAANTAGARRITEIRVDDLELGRPVFALLRKPDFQRVTANWSSDKVSDFIESFLKGEFVPSLIMWESTLSGKLFVIDGAHRLSALMAWVNNDYGNGVISKTFFGEDGISETQKRFAKTASEMISISYADLKLYAQQPEKAPTEEARVLARKLFTSKLDLQWVIGPPQTAENSFFKINVSATIIDDTELAILKARKKPNAIATRALIHAGRGHKFWLDFPNEVQKEIEAVAYDVHDVLFKPILQDPIKTTELPVAGHSYLSHSFQMLLDLVNMVNEITPSSWIEPKRTPRKKSTGAKLEDDDPTTGAGTIKFLKMVRNAAWLITGNHNGSLGLHPVVYFYGASGRFHPAPLLAAIKFFRQLDREGKLMDFTLNRFAFEEFLVTHRHFINQLSHSKGSRTRPVDPIVAMYEIVLQQVKNGSDRVSTVAALHSDQRLKDLAGC